jgi:hypothetical protein
VAQAAALAALQEQLSAEWQQELDTQRGQLVSQPPAERRHPAAAAPPLADATPCYAHSAVYWVAVPRVLHPLRPSNGAWHGYWVAVPRGLPCGDVSVGARFSWSSRLTGLCLVLVRAARAASAARQTASYEGDLTHWRAEAAREKSEREAAEQLLLAERAASAVTARPGAGREQPAALRAATQRRLHQRGTTPYHLRNIMIRTGILNWLRSTYEFEIGSAELGCGAGTRRLRRLRLRWRLRHHRPRATTRRRCVWAVVLSRTRVR